MLYQQLYYWSLHHNVSISDFCRLTFTLENIWNTFVYAAAISVTNFIVSVGFFIFILHAFFRLLLKIDI